MSAVSSAKEAVQKGLTPIFLVVLLILTAFILVVSNIAYNGSNAWYGFPLQAWFVPFLYVVLIMELLGKYSKRLRLNPTQYVLLFIPMFLMAGRPYTVDGVNRGLYSLFGWLEGPSFTAYTIGNLASPGSPSWITAFQTLPSYVTPAHNVAAAMIEWNGLKAGQTVPWGAYMGPIVFWSILAIVLVLFNLSLSFTVLGPEWTETEKLVFPYTIPTIYLIQTATTRDEGGHPLLLNTKTSNMRVFWIALVIGIIASIPNTMALVPAYSWMTNYGYGDLPIPNNFYAAMQSVLPGATFDGTFSITMAAFAIILPYDLLISALVAWLAIPVLYDAIAIKAGWVTFVPGADFGQYGSELPFPYRIWGFIGLSVGLGVYFIWKMRGRFAKVLKTLTGPTYYQGDLSVKTGAWMLVSTAVLLIILFTAFGDNPIMSIVLVILYLIWSVAGARIAAEFWPSLIPDLRYWWVLWWPIGAGLGIWQNVPAQINGPLTASATLDETVGASYSEMAANPALSTYMYKIAHDTKASIKDVFNLTAILEIIFIPISIVFAVWLFAHIGNGNTPIAYVADASEGMGITGFSKGWYPGETFAAVWGWTIGGIVLIFLLMWLRSVFPWFIFTPVGLIASVAHPDYLWSAVVVGLVLKYLLSKSLGPRRTEEYVIPAASGFGLGFGVLYLFAALYLFFSSALPWTLANWKP
ncbi:MAG: DUF6785 family protein [Thermoprotei archaeon]